MKGRSIRPFSSRPSIVRLLDALEVADRVAAHRDADVRGLAPSHDVAHERPLFDVDQEGQGRRARLLGVAAALQRDLDPGGALGVDHPPQRECDLRRCGDELRDAQRHAGFVQLERRGQARVGEGRGTVLPPGAQTREAGVRPGLEPLRPVELDGELQVRFGVQDAEGAAGEEEGVGPLGPESLQAQAGAAGERAGLQAGVRREPVHQIGAGRGGQLDLPSAAGELQVDVLDLKDRPVRSGELHPAAGRREPSIGQRTERRCGGGQDLAGIGERRRTLARRHGRDREAHDRGLEAHGVGLDAAVQQRPKPQADGDFLGAESDAVRGGGARRGDARADVREQREADRAEIDLAAQRLGSVPADQVAGLGAVDQDARQHPHEHGQEEERERPGQKREFESSAEFHCALPGSLCGPNPGPFSGRERRPATGLSASAEEVKPGEGPKTAGL